MIIQNQTNQITLWNVRNASCRIQRCMTWRWLTGHSCSGGAMVCIFVMWPDPAYFQTCIERHHFKCGDVISFNMLVTGQQMIKTLWWVCICTVFAPAASCSVPDSCPVYELTSMTFWPVGVQQGSETGPGRRWIKNKEKGDSYILSANGPVKIAVWPIPPETRGSIPRSSYSRDTGIRYSRRRWSLNR